MKPSRAAGEARLLEQGDRLLRIEGQRLHVEVIGPAARREGPGDDGALAVEEGVEHLLPVHGIGKGLAHALVREQRVPDVVPEERIGQRVVGLQDEALVALDLGDVARVHQHDHVDGVEHQRLGHDVLVREGLCHELVEVRPALEIIVVGGEDDLALGRDALQHVGTGADRVLHEGIVARQVRWIGRPVLGDDLEAELGQGVQDRPLEGELDGIVVHLLDARR